MKKSIIKLFLIFAVMAIIGPGGCKNYKKSYDSNSNKDVNTAQDTNAPQGKDESLIEKGGNAVKKGADTAVKTVESGAEKAGDAAKDAGDKAKDVVDDVVK